MRGTFTSGLIRSMATALLIGAATAAQAVYTPVTLTGFNADVIANGIGLPTLSTTQPYDAATANPNYVLVSQDFQATSTSVLPTYFLPMSGTLSSLATSGMTYQLAPYTGNNALRLTGTTSPANTGTLSFPAPNTLIGDVYIIGSTGSGTATVSGTINFAQGGSQAFTATFADWFNGTVVAVQGVGRAARGTGVLDAGAGSTNPRFYELKVPLAIANYGKTISGITFTRTGGSSTTSVLNIMAVSVDHQSCLPTLSLAASAITTTGATLTWTAATGSQAYEYALTMTATPPATGTSYSALSYPAAGLFPGTTYYFHVRNKCGTNSYSVWHTIPFTTLACPTAGAPAIVTNVPGTVTYNWPGTAVAGVTNYQYAVTQSTAVPTVWQTTSNTQVTVPGLTPGATYYAHVRSNCTNTQAGDQFVQFINPFPPCYAPAAIAVNHVNMHGANIRWNSSTTVPPAQGYQYAINTNPAPPAAGTPTPDTSYTATSLTAGVKYYMYVRTHCGTTNFSPWVKDSFTTPGTCMPAPAPLVTNVTSTSADISWDPFPGIYGYEYVLNNNPVAPSFAGAAINFNNFSPASLFTGTTYYFHLRVRCDTFNYSPYVTTSFTTQPVCTQPAGLVMTDVTTTTATFSWLPVPGAPQYQYTVSSSSSPVPGNTYTSVANKKVIGLNPGTSYYFHVRANCSASDSSDWETIAFNTLTVSVGSVSADGTELIAYPNPVTDILRVELRGEPKGEGELILSDLSGKLLRRTVLRDGAATIDLRPLSGGIYLLRYRDSENTGVIRVRKH